MKSVFDKISDTIDNAEQLAVVSHPFYAFEPWDVEERTDLVKQQAMDDGIDLYHADIIKHIGIDPHPFQSGFMLSTKYNTNLLASSQSGKSWAATIKGLIMASGEIPFSMRYAKGVDTGIKRVINKYTITRFGRISKDDGKVIDHNIKAERNDSWDCGNIIGAGIFPQEMIAPEGSEIRIGTLQRVKIEVWWPRLAEKRALLMPDHFIDRTRGANGYNKKDGLIYLPRNCQFSILTYEMDAQKFEGVRAWYTILDEEPPNQNLIPTVVTHTHYWSLCETPYKGITYSKKIFFPDKISPNSQTFHSTAYDCPYKTLEGINRERETMPIWEIGARIWGMPTELRGSPYFDRKKISGWINKYARFIPYQWAQFVPSSNWHGIVSRPDITTVAGLLDTHVNIIPLTEDNLQTAWRVYEERKAGTAYLFAGDPAEGAMIPGEAGDISAAIIVRPPESERGEKRPIIVATLRSTLETIPFTKNCVYACRYYNNATIASEITGSASATFANELKDWPYWYMHVSTQDSTGKQREKRGFTTSSKSRDAIFDLIKSWILDFGEHEYPYIPDESLLVELAGAIVSQKSSKQRCDHTDSGTLDLTIAFGIILYVFEYALDQVRCNQKEEVKERKNRRNIPQQKTSACGMSFMGLR